MEIKYTTRFRKHYQNAGKEIKAAFAQTLELFLEDPNHPTLRNHPLKEEFTGYRSINVTDDCRAILKEVHRGNNKTVTFHLLRTHKELYG